MGEELFEGSLHYRCADPNEGGFLGFNGRTRRLKGGGGGGPSADFCRKDDHSTCAPGTECIYFEDNPEGQDVHFDTVTDASMAILQVFTFDTWNNVMCGATHTPQSTTVSACSPLIHTLTRCTGTT